MQNKIKILFSGDLTGRPGRYALRDFLLNLPEDTIPDFVIANVENASHGFGLTEKNYEEISSYGVDCMTSGNHIWDKKDIFEFIETADKLIRPANYPEVPGVGFRIFETQKGKVGVLNLLGRNFMPVIDSPRYAAEHIIKEIQKETPVIIMDFHAEATAEKLCFAKYFSSLGISAFIGTHTHVQTADEMIIDGRTAYISDVGFCGDTGGVIGMDYEGSLRRMTNMLPERFQVASSGKVCVNAVYITIDTVTGIAEDIKRIIVKTELRKE